MDYTECSTWCITWCITAVRCLTLLAIYHRSGSKDGGGSSSSSGSSGRALARTSLAALLLPLLSPASVLAFYLASQHASQELTACHAALVTTAQVT